jgi:signal transduction histidine kinase
LHDQIGQILTAIKMDLTWMTRHLPKSESDVLARLAESIQSINDGVKSVRTICSGLRPGVLDDLGLAAAIEWQASEFASRNGVECQVTVPPVDLHLDGDRATATFRIFQECLTNVIRHAQAKSVRITLLQEEENILLIVADDGIGFRESDLSNSLGSLGLLGMKERAQFCGGDVQISSSPGNGTTVTVRVPVDVPSPTRSESCTS